MAMLFSVAMSPSLGLLMTEMKSFNRLSVFTRISGAAARAPVPG
jgi:hypothetical protein